MSLYPTSWTGILYKRNSGLIPVGVLMIWGFCFVLQEENEEDLGASREFPFSE